MQNITKISLTWELYQEDVPQTHIAGGVGVHRVIVYRWYKGIREEGEFECFFDYYFTILVSRREEERIGELMFF